MAEPYGILVTGVGGTGVVTIGALLGMAAHLEGKGVTVLDQLGMAQKGRRGDEPCAHRRERPRRSTRCASPPASARLLLGCDLVVSASAEALSQAAARAQPRDRQQPRDDHRRLHPQPRPAVSRAATCERSIAAAVGQGGAEFVDATGLATGLLGDSIATNLFMLGYAYQQGLVPVSAAAIERAIELNAVAVDFNRAAFRLGPARRGRPRRWSKRAPRRTRAVPESHRLSESLDELIARRVAFLTEYQDAAYAARYAARIRPRPRRRGRARCAGTRR